MSRLTKVYPNGNVTLDASQFPPIAQEVIDSEINNSVPFTAAVKKLKEFEDKAEGAAPWQTAVDTRTAAMQEIIALYQDNIAPITSIVLHSISDWLNDIDADVIKWAIAEAVSHNKRSWKYVEGILKNHFNAGRTTLAEIEMENKNFKNRKSTQLDCYRDDDFDYAELEKLERLIQEKG